jgi:hypothetical protein
LEVVSPQRTDLVLTTNVPHGELNVLIFDGLDVESYFPPNCILRQLPPCDLACARAAHDWDARGGGRSPRWEW